MPDRTDLVTPLWRGVVALRIVTAAFAVAAIVVHHDDFARPDLGWVVLVGIAVWTVVTCLAYSYQVTRRIHMIVLDLVVTLALTASSVLVLAPGQLAPGQFAGVTGPAPLLTTVWAVGPVTAAAVHAGRIAGVLFGVAVAAVSVWARGFVSTTLVRDALLLVGAGFVIGLAATTARRATEQLRRAARAEAATARREQAARAVYGDVLQVLSMLQVQARSSRLGAPAAELVRMAGEQELALRALVSAAPVGTGSGDQAPGDQDLVAALRAQLGPRVEMSVPATAVLLPASDVDELVVVAREVLTCATRHAGPDATTRLLLADLGEEVVLTIRHEGPDPDGEQSAAAPVDGMLQASRSIRDRVADLGATLTVDTGPGTVDTGPERHTEWQVRLSRTKVVAVQHGDTVGS